jgi:DNA-directed RNA polymerase subunit L
MDVSLVKKDDKSAEIIIKGDPTITVLVRGYLLQDENVDFAAYRQDHPLFDEMRLFVRVKKGDPLEAIRLAIERAKADVISFETAVSDALKD